MNNEIKECDNHGESYYKKLTLPNIITTTRIVASIALFTNIALYGITSPLLVTLAALGIGATDALDGYLARNCGMSSQLGSVLDPIADKVYNWGLGITLMATGIMPLWPLLISVRDAAVFGFTTYQFKKNGKELKPTIPAKLKMVLQSAGVVSTLAFGFGSEGLSLIAPICMGGAIATVVPEVFCIKHQYFNKKEEEDSKKEETRTTEKNQQEETKKEKSKTLSYDSLTQSYIKETPKIKKKSIFNKN